MGESTGTYVQLIPISYYHMIDELLFYIHRDDVLDIESKNIYDKCITFDHCYANI